MRKLKIKGKGMFLGGMFLAMVSCFPEPIEVQDVPQVPQAIVVSSVLIPDEGISVVLSYTFSALERGDKNDSVLLKELLLESALVEVASADQSLVLDKLDAGVYASNGLKAKPNTDFTLDVADENTPLVATATSKLLPRAFFDAMELRYEHNNEEVIPYIAYQFKDLPGKNYYVINVQKLIQRNASLEELINAKTFSYLIEDDESQDTIEGSFSITYNKDYEIGDTLMVSLGNISPAYYDYLDKRNQSFFLIDVVSEPYNLPTNINGGYGFFELFVPDSWIETMNVERK